MRKMILIPQLILGFFFFQATLAQGASSDYAQFKLYVYIGEDCTGPVRAISDIDTSKSCNNFSYTDKSGKTSSGSIGNFRCEADKFILDKFPFKGNCKASSKDIVNRKYAVPATQCQVAKSHDGSVSERLEGYEYPGSVDCKKTPATK
jgi:hypothetical protein